MKRTPSNRGTIPSHYLCSRLPSRQLRMHVSNSPGTNRRAKMQSHSFFVNFFLHVFLVVFFPLFRTSVDSLNRVLPWMLTRFVTVSTIPLTIFLRTSTEWNEFIYSIHANYSALRPISTLYLIYSDTALPITYDITPFRMRMT